MSDVVVLLVTVRQLAFCFFLVGLDKKVGDILFRYLMVLLHCNELVFGLEHQLTLTFLEKAHCGDFYLECNLVVNG